MTITQDTGDVRTTNKRNFTNVSHTRQQTAVQSGTRDSNCSSPPLPLHSPHPTQCRHLATAALVTLSPRPLPAERHTSPQECLKDPGGHPLGPEGAGRWMHHQATTASPDQEYLHVGGGTAGGSIYNYNLVFLWTLHYSSHFCLRAYALATICSYSSSPVVKNGWLLSKPYQCTVPPVSTTSQHSQRKR